MQNLERSKFEENWKEVFDDAGVSPSESVWETLEQKLTQAEGDSMRTRVVFYQRMTAACILFALLAGGFGFYYWNEDSNRFVKNASAQNNDRVDLNSKSNSIDKETDQSSFLSDRKAESKRNENLSENKITNRTNVNESNKGSTNTTQKTENNSGEKSSNNNNGLILPNENRPSAQLPKEELRTLNHKQFESNLNLPQPELLPVAGVSGELVYTKWPAISSTLMNETNEEEFDAEKLWTSVTVASGTYAAYNSGSSYYANSGNMAPNNSSTPIGTSYTFGVLGGVRFSGRWIFQSGVQYMKQSAGYSSNIATGGSLYVLGNPAQYNGTISSPYGIISTNEFVSVPVFIGYILVNKKIGWQINSGIASDFFVRNTLSDPSGRRQSYSHGAGSDSPYRSVNFAGLINTEVSYKIGKNYRVSLVPGLRHSFNPILKSQSSGNQLVWDIGFRFRYILR